MDAINTNFLFKKFINFYKSVVKACLDSIDEDGKREARGQRIEAYEGHCPDPYCFERTIVPNVDENSLALCFHCGQTYPTTKLLDMKSVDPCDVDNFGLLHRLQEMFQPKASDWVRIFGLSPFHCKLVSPLLTKFHADENETRCTDDSFDCRLLSDLAFAIDECHVNTKGYGRDRHGSQQYLANTLSLIKEHNDGREALVPLHVGGDGSCLVHAVSRALVGREIYWHALRQNVRLNLTANEQLYKNTLGSFIAEDDWQEIVNECDAAYLPQDENLGLRTVHIFALANVLCRPIILLDIPELMKIGAEFSATFLPIARSVDECKDDTGNLNSPIVIAWADANHTHFVPLVAVKGHPDPMLPRSILPKAFAIDDGEVDRYVNFQNDFCTVSVGRLIEDSDTKRLITVMDRIFTRRFGVNPEVLCDYCENVLDTRRFVSINVNDDMKNCLSAGNENRLYRCLICWRLSEVKNLSNELADNGTIFQEIQKAVGTLLDGQCYVYQDVKLKYDLTSKRFDFVDLLQCPKCGYSANQCRLQLTNGKIRYKNGDHTRTPAPLALCKRKMKHVWKGEEYDSMPLLIKLKVTGKDKMEYEDIYWFAFESDANRNSNLKRIANEIVSKYVKDPKGYQSAYSSTCKEIKKALNSFKLSVDRLCTDPLWNNFENFVIKPKHSLTITAASETELSESGTETFSVESPSNRQTKSESSNISSPAVV